MRRLGLLLLGLGGCLVQPAPFRALWLHLRERKLSAFGAFHVNATVAWIKHVDEREQAQRVAQSNGGKGRRSVIWQEDGR